MKGEDFREDLRTPGSGNTEARRILSAEEISPLTQLHDWKSGLSIIQTLTLISMAAYFIVSYWGSVWIVGGLVLMAIAQHSLFILSHEATHYRLLSNRMANDFLGRLIGMTSGISMFTYRVTHRLHHNNLYSAQDPDTAIHGGYPRGARYLWRKLALDVVGWNAWKTYAYFFGSPAINEDTQQSIRPLEDTSPVLRQSARRDRWLVVVAQLSFPLVAWVAGGWHGLALYLVIWVVPLVTLLQPILRLRAICEHGAVTDLSSPLTAARSNQTFGSFTNYVGRVILFPHHVNYHLEHHLYPAVPHYHLPALHRALIAKNALQHAEVRNIMQTMALIFAPRKMFSKRVS